MKTHIAQISGWFVVMVLLTLPAWAEPAESESAVEKDNQRTACDARCREDYQSNASALQACLRDCGAIGPAAPAAIPENREGKPSRDKNVATTVKSSKSNSSDRTPQPQATTVKSSKSNSDNRIGAPTPPVPVEASNLNLSKSNINRQTEPEHTDTIEDSKGQDDEDQ